MKVSLFCGRKASDWRIVVGVGGGEKERAVRLVVVEWWEGAMVDARRCWLVMG